MQFRVVIPEHVKAGQMIRIHCPDGTEANVKVPKGLKTGDSFVFDIAVEQLNNPQILLDQLRERALKSMTTNNTNNNNNNNTMTSSKLKNAKNANAKSTNSKTAPTSSSTTNKTINTITNTKKLGFLDKEIVNVQDFLLALGVGLIIGLGIVLGFLAGILYATKDVAPSSMMMMNPPVQQPPTQLGEAALHKLRTTTTTTTTKPNE